ncbi:MAG: hypothetical protein GY832_40755 [Chloroflexi bacterium]|nr:hypothetical protein [Chloroflexota bacterium]
MSKEKSPILLKALSVVITIVQFFDIYIHAATDQLEPLRVASNLIILAWTWIVVLLAGKLGEKIKSITIGSIGAYLGLNIIFLALEGLTNPNNGTLRVTLFLLVILTTAFSAGLFTQLKRN